MKWYHYLFAIGAGFFFGNAVPHFVAGSMGQMFPSPFATPPGVGLSSPLVNVLWGLANIAIGTVLIRVGRVEFGNRLSVIAVFLGLGLVSIVTSIVFGSASGNPSF